jgi:hypothetical protein
MFNTADQFVSRLREIEKIKLRASTEGELEFLADKHKWEFVNPETAKALFDQAVAKVKAEFKQASLHPTFGRTWAI